MAMVRKLLLPFIIFVLFLRSFKANKMRHTLNYYEVKAIESKPLPIMNHHLASVIKSVYTPAVMLIT